MVTKVIDIASIMKRADSKSYAEYFPLFQIGRVLAAKARETIKEMTDERSIYIWQEYERRGKEWHELHNIKREVEGKTKKRVFSAVMKQKCKEILYTELKNLYPQWRKTETTPFNSDTSGNISAITAGAVNRLQNIENLRALQYEL